MFARCFSLWLINSTYQQVTSKYKFEFRVNSYYLADKKEVIPQQIKNQSKCALSYTPAEIKTCLWN